MTIARHLAACALAALLTGVAAEGAIAQAPRSPAAAPGPPASLPGVEQIDGKFPDGTAWIVQMPPKWNGTLLLNLDGARPTQGGAVGADRNAFDVWLLSKGYALAGTTREPVGYDFPKAVDYLLTVRGTAAARWGEPKRTLMVGNSRGAFVVRKAMELHPEVFAGGLMSSGGGAGEIAVLRNKLNSLFVLKTLVDPTAPLKLVNIDVPAENAALAALVAKARATPEGRARLAFAAAMQQFAPWSSRGKPKPAADDYEAQLDQTADNFAFATAVLVRGGVEKIAGGNVSWNTDADYADLLRRSGRRPMVEALYRKAGLDLQADLAVLAKAPRISADPAAVRRAEPPLTYSGRIKAPLVNVDNDDPVDPAADKLAYQRTLEKAGAADLFRLLWSDGPGHGGQTPIDRAVGFDLLIERIDSGRWADTSLPALRARAERIRAASSVDLGRLNLFEPTDIPAPLNTWDFTNWGTYAPVR